MNQLGKEPTAHMQRKSIWLHIFSPHIIVACFPPYSSLHLGSPHKTNIIKITDTQTAAETQSKSITSSHQALLEPEGF